MNKEWGIITDNTNSDQSASTHAPQGTARYPTKARGPTQKPPHPQIRLDSCAVLPKIPPGIPGLQIFGSHRQDSAICVKESHKQNLRPVPGPRPALREHKHQHPSHHQRHLVIITTFWSSKSNAFRQSKAETSCRSLFCHFSQATLEFQAVSTQCWVQDWSNFHQVRQKYCRIKFSFYALEFLKRNPKSYLKFSMNFIKKINHCRVLWTNSKFVHFNKMASSNFMEFSKGQSKIPISALVLDVNFCLRISQFQQNRLARNALPFVLVRPNLDPC